MVAPGWRTDAHTVVQMLFHSETISCQQSTETRFQGDSSKRLCSRDGERFCTSGELWTSKHESERRNKRALMS